MAFIALYYPPSDARTHFRTGTTVQVTGPVFHTYAEAAAQLGDEEVDARRYRSHVLPYVLEVSPGRGGYQIVDVFEAEGRESNPRSKKAKMTPVGHLVAGDDGEQIQMPLLLGIEGGEEYLYEPDDAADLYGQFMGQHAPAGASARKIAHAFHTTTTPPAKKREAEAKNAAREKAIRKVAASVDHDVATHGYAGAIEKSEERLEAVKDALASGQITPTEAAGPIALETKKQEILLILERFCPLIGPEGTEAIYSVVTATLGGDARAAEAGRVILEGVASKLVGHSVEVDNGRERPTGGVAISIESASGSGRRAASRQAAPEAAEPAKAKSLGPVTASAAASAFLKSNAGKLAGFEPKLVKSIVANALGLSPFPVDAPLADLRAASERVYGLLRSAGLAQASTLAAPVARVSAPAPIAVIEEEPAPPVRPVSRARVASPEEEAAAERLEQLFSTGQSAYPTTREGFLAAFADALMFGALPVNVQKRNLRHMRDALIPGGIERLSLGTMAQRAWVAVTGKKGVLTYKALRGLPSDEAPVVPVMAPPAPVAEVPKSAFFPTDGPPRTVISPEMRKQVEAAVKIAAISVETLRKSDVFRVLEEAHLHKREQLAEVLKVLRPDLAQAIHDAAEELGVSMLTKAPAPVMAPPVRPAAAPAVDPEIEMLTRQIDELNGEIEDLSLDGGVSVTLMGQGGALKTAAKEALRLSRSPEGPDRVRSLRKRVADLAAGIDKAKADKQAEKDTAMQRAREIAARSAAPAPSVPQYDIERNKRNAEAAETARLQELGLSVVPGIRGEESEMAGRLWERLQSGDLDRSRWEDWLDQLKRANKIRTPAAPAVDPEKAAQDRLLAQIQEANDKAMAALLAKLGG